MYIRSCIPLILGAMFLGLTCIRGAFPEKAEAQVVDVGSHMAVVTPTPIPIITDTSMEGRYTLSQQDIDLIALVTMAEAEGECEEGKRRVIDTILNRIDSGYFPDTAYEVIYQPSQFSSVWNGRIERCEVREDICGLVQEEIVSRRDHDVMFFTAGGYSDYGSPMYQIGNHYFSSYI